MCDERSILVRHLQMFAWGVDLVLIFTVWSYYTHSFLGYYLGLVSKARIFGDKEERVI